MNKLAQRISRRRQDGHGRKGRQGPLRHRSRAGALCLGLPARQAALRHDDPCRRSAHRTRAGRPHCRLERRRGNRPDHRPGRADAWHQPRFRSNVGSATLSRPNSAEAFSEEPVALRPRRICSNGSVSEAPPAHGRHGVNADSRRSPRRRVLRAAGSAHARRRLCRRSAIARRRGDDHRSHARGRSRHAGRGRRRCAGRLCARRRRAVRAAAREIVVGVTGTNGKSSIVSFVRQIWTAAGFKAASVGTVGIETASAASCPGELTTPDALSLARDARPAQGRRASSTSRWRPRARGSTSAASTGCASTPWPSPISAATTSTITRTWTPIATPSFGSSPTCIADGGAAVVNVDDPELRALHVRGARRAA